MENSLAQFDTIALSVGFKKMLIFCKEIKNAHIKKIEGILVLKVLISGTTYVWTYVLNFKFLA